MSLRAEIAVIDDDENVVGIAKVPLYDSDVLPGMRGPFAENMVTDPDTGEVYKFTFQAEVVGQIAPTRDEVASPMVGDVVRVIANTSRHHFDTDALVEVEEVFSNGSINATGAGRSGGTVAQHLFRDDYILE